MGATSVVNAALYDKSGEGLLDFVNWAIALVTLQPDAYTHLIDAATPQKIHIFIGLCVFLIVPFTRLIHIWSGYASPIYLMRNMQKMRMNGAPMGKRSARRSPGAHWRTRVGMIPHESLR